MPFSNTPSSGLPWPTPIETDNTLPANPASTVSTVGVMMGLALTYTPTSTGQLLVLINGDFETLAAIVTATATLRFGVGAPPANGAAAVGTVFGPAAGISGTPQAFGAPNLPFTLMGQVTGLALGVAAWIDVQLATSNVADAALITNLSSFIMETS